MSTETEETTSEETPVIFSESQLVRYPAALDGLFDFNKLNVTFKFLWLFKINIGAILEKYDSEGFEKALELVNTLAKNGKISNELIELFTAILTNLDSSDETDFVGVIVDYILGKIDAIPDEVKVSIKGVVAGIVVQFGDFLDKLNEEIDSLVLKAE